MNNVVVTSTSEKDLSHYTDVLYDEGLLRLIIENKDEGAVRTLINRYASRTYYLVLLFTLNHKLSKRVTQTVFHSVKALDAENIPMDFKTWLYALTISKTRKYLKDSEAIHEGQVIDKDHEIQERLFSDGGFDVKEGLFNTIGHKSSEYIPLVEKALFELPATYRVAVYLSDIEKMPPESIQRVLGFSGPTVESMIYNSRLYIMQQLSSYIKKNRVL